MSTKAIRTSNAHSACDVCGRTLLRGERAEVYLNGGTRRSVCELCTSRAVHGGWVREGTLPAYDDSDAKVDRRRSLLSRLRSRRDAPAADVSAAAEEEQERAPRATPTWTESGARRADERARERERDRGRERDRVREPRRVRAIPTSGEHKVASAVESFNSSEHPRTVAGVARSLGLPEVVIQPSDVRLSVVNVVVSWELCWYRYEVDLSDEVPSVRVAGQGYELDELAPEERQPNASADEHGRLVLSF